LQKALHHNPVTTGTIFQDKRKPLNEIGRDLSAAGEYGT